MKTCFYSCKKNVKLRKLEKNAEQQEQDFKDVEERAAWAHV